MPSEAYSIRSSRVVANGRVGGGVVFVRGEKIERVELDGGPIAAQPTRAQSEIDVGNLVLMPGLVDTHVHVNEPGRTDWEGFETAGRAAAAGGITTIVVMPLNCTPAATSVDALLGEARAAAGKCLVDYGLWGGLIPGNADQLEPMWNAGALGFKCFMLDSGVDDFPGSSVDDLLAAAPILSRLGAPLLVHAEEPELLARAKGASGLADSPDSYQAYLSSRPPESELVAVAMLRLLSTAHCARVHIVHVSCPQSAGLIAKYKADGLAFTAETCPHYLRFVADQIPDGATEFKCAPPIRDGVTRQGLWDRLMNGDLDMVVSDHSPCPPVLKCTERGSFAYAWGGIASLQLGLSAVWTGSVEPGSRQPTLPDIARWMCENPADLAGISGRKGRIAPGQDADLVVFDPDAEWVVRGQDLHHRHKLTPYDGMTLRGVVKRTILRGRTIYDADASNPFPLEPIGQWIKRDT